MSALAFLRRRPLPSSTAIEIARVRNILVEVQAKLAESKMIRLRRDMEILDLAVTAIGYLRDGRPSLALDTLNKLVVRLS